MGLMRVEEASLIAVADAIREKGGTSEGLSFPEGFVNAVAGIQAGGICSGSGIATGYFIPEADLGSDCDVTITHNLGEVPKLAVLYREATNRYMGETIVSGEVAFSYVINSSRIGVGFYYSSNGYSSKIELAVMQTNSNISLTSEDNTKLSGSCFYSCTETTSKLYPIKNNTKKFVAGNKYRWILMTESAYNAMNS